ncbi:MAG: F0F1 ATP synthase subunit A [Muribaculaceae bacterium]|nr:F0F1 ATP synthase subunit A [Muribaculaceae bacterium]
MNRLKQIIFSLIVLLMVPVVGYAAQETTNEHKEGELDAKEIIFEHLGDGYGWEVPFDHHHRIPLPVIVMGEGGFHVFSSSRISNGKTYTVDGVEYKIAGVDSPHKGRVVAIIDGKEYRPWDFSITKNVAALWICVLVVCLLLLGLASYHKKNGFKTPRRLMGAVEGLTDFIWNGAVKPILGPKARKFAPYLMTAFWFILVMNLLGLIVVFPGGANLTGNIAITLVLATLTFLVTNLYANKHYWKEIFWPDVPLMLKFPIPLMQIIEFFGMFTKPAALTVRLFANMLSGHMIVLVLTILIFIFSATSPYAGAGTTVVSVLFSIFMMLIDVLVSFIQAYVFTILSTLFIALAQEHGEEHGEKVEDRLKNLEL